VKARICKCFSRGEPHEDDAKEVRVADDLSAPNEQKKKRKRRESRPSSKIAEVPLGKHPTL